jgi:hypothetical protein
MCDDTLPLDEEEEHYGYGILNVHRNQFVSPLGALTAETKAMSSATKTTYWSSTRS